eukprot:EC852452.1.p1 GENE.EC852452.1~~EC852452.1.p1  ORF type:complete len:177 (+),score=11.29 EC852452.1:61-591(+)
MSGGGPSGDAAGGGSKPELLFKILVVGDVGTGKTSIIRKYVHNMFSDTYKSTIGVDFALKVVHRPNVICRLQLWDIAGQERFGQMTRVYYKDAVGAFVVFDVGRRDSFDAVMKWKLDLDRKVHLADQKTNVPCVLLANRADIEESKWEVHDDEIREWFKNRILLDLYTRQPCTAPV